MAFDIDRNYLRVLFDNAVDRLIIGLVDRYVEKTMGSSIEVGKTYMFRTDHDTVQGTVVKITPSEIAMEDVTCDIPQDSFPYLGDKCGHKPLYKKLVGKYTIMWQTVLAYTEVV